MAPRPRTSALRASGFSRTDENTNGLLREHCPNGTDLSRWSAEEIEAVAHTLNTGHCTTPSPTSSTPPPAGSTGTTNEGSTRPWETFHQSNTSMPATLPSTESPTPHRNAREPGVLQSP